MVLDRITEKAKKVLLNFSGREIVGANEVLVAIKDSAGLGTEILDIYPKIRINRSKQVKLDVLVEEAFYQSIKYKHYYVGTEHLLLALLKLVASPDEAKVQKKINSFNTFPGVVKVYEEKRSSVIESFGENLTNKITRSYGDLLTKRGESRMVASVLLQKNKPNLLLVGDDGVGKHTLVETLVHDINKLDVPMQLMGSQVIEFDLVAFIASISSRESLEQYLTMLIEDAVRYEKLILYIKNFQDLFISTNTGLAVPLALSMLRSDLNNIGVHMIATISSSLYQRLAEENAHILEDFSVVHVEEPSEELTLNIMNTHARILGYYHGVSIPESLVKLAYEKSNNRTTDVKFPQKGIDLLDKACAHLIVKRGHIPEKIKKMMDRGISLSEDMTKSLEGKDYSSAVKIRKHLQKLEEDLLETEKYVKKNTETKLVLLESDLDAVFTDASLYGGADSEYNTSTLGSLAGDIRERILGQDDAVDAVSKSLIRSGLGLRPSKRPWGNFLFLGPTGVGKTELAKVLADVLFGKDSLIRLDMSDFGEKHTVSRLVGAPPGYVGYGEGGELTQKIERNPASVVLFDEIEKAHPEVLNILLQIMEEGELADARGSTFDFSSAVIILTSNLGTELVQQFPIGFGNGTLSVKDIEKRLRGNLKKVLKPELINRFDEIIVFKPLRKDAQKGIVNLMLGDVIESLKSQKISLRVYSDVKKLLLREGYSDEYGARSLRRTVERGLLDKIAEFLLAHAERPLKLNARVKNGSIYIEKV